MSTTQSGPDQDKARPRDPAPVFLDARREFAERFLAGEGLEIGALHLPLRTPARAHVRYVDRMSVEDLRAEYAELDGVGPDPGGRDRQRRAAEHDPGGLAGLHRRQPLPRALRGPDPHDRDPPGQAEARRRPLLRGSRQALHLRQPAAADAARPHGRRPRAGAGALARASTTTSGPAWSSTARRPPAPRGPRSRSGRRGGRGSSRRTPTRSTCTSGPRRSSWS